MSEFIKPVEEQENNNSYEFVVDLLRSSGLKSSFIEQVVKDLDSLKGQPSYKSDLEWLVKQLNRIKNEGLTQFGRSLRKTMQEDWKSRLEQIRF